MVASLHRAFVPTVLRPAPLFAALAALSVIGCSDSATPEPVPASVAVQLAAARLDPGDTTRVTVKAQDASGRDLTVRSPTFASSNTAIARIDTTGKVTAVSEGSVVLTATVRGVSGNGSLVVSYAVATVAVTLPLATIENGDTIRVMVTARSAKGVTIGGRGVTYSTSNGAVATVSDAGLVRGESIGTATITATVDSTTGSTSVTVQVRAASVVASQDSLRLAIQATAQLSAQGFDAGGNALQGRTIIWTSADAERASVSSTGVVTWRGPGRTAVLARLGSAIDTVHVSSAGDFSIAGVHLTQGVQDADGSIPLIVQGGSAAMAVLVSTAVATNASLRIVLRLTDAAGALVVSDTKTVANQVGPSPSLAAPTAHFLVPTAQLLTGRRWQVVLDPLGEVRDDTAANDVYPRGGPTPLVVSAVPALNIRFVPITLDAHGGSTPTVTNVDLQGYLRTALSTLPLGQVNAVLAAPFTTTASFGTQPSGGAQAFWVQVLQELDAARVASDDPATYWYGVVGPPAGFNFTQFGGFGFVPNDPTASGAGTRTALGVRTNWFFNQTQARDLVAHELAHNFGRRHSPCGGPGGLDSSYPRTDGRMGETMHDVYAWANGLTATLQPVSAETGDLMGYCFSSWSSAYTYRGVLDARGSAATIQSTARETTRREEVLVVQGTVDADGQAKLDHPIVLLGFRARAHSEGDHRLQGIDEEGRVLFERAVHPASVDHADVKLFTVTVPLDAPTRRLHSLRLAGPRGTVSIAASPAAIAPEMRRDADGAITVSCGNASARVAVQDVRTGDLLGIAWGQLRIASTRNNPFGVSCSNGALPRRTTMRAP